ncbi:DUF2267 domain-containing protein [Sorangium sp. So ce406]|uniref:DUF2267 domain-containing protein n=1 Tax=Sorangium sp. So ce406 TaxID=3133311 RepID=UPI003F5B4A0D
MLCSELMNNNPVSVLPNTTVQKAALLMRAESIGFLPVCDASGKVLGTVTDRDIAIRNVADGNPPSASIDDVMTREVVACRPEDDVQVAEVRMSLARKARIVCTDEEGHLRGVISLSDIAQNDVAERAAETLRAVTSREAPPAGGLALDAKSARILERLERDDTLPVGVEAPDAAGAVLCVLSRRLSGGEAKDLAQALPPPLRRLVLPCVTHRGERPERFGRDKFLQMVAEHLDTTPTQAEAVARAVFSAIQAELPEEEVIAVESQLPSDLKELWGRRRPAA